MNQLSITEVDKIAHLARLGLSEQEVVDAARQLNNTLALIDAMQAVDTTGVVPLAHVHDLAQRLRPDVVTEQDQRERLLANAPDSEQGLFLVPKVIE